MLKGNEIRDLYLNYFKDKHQHTIVESSSLVPDNPTVLLTTAGMLQFVPYYLGIEKVPFDPARAVSCQKCARAGGKDSDIENVGRTPRHHTFFEMLGNFSFGDYYKKEVIPWAWEFVTEGLKLDKDRLWITIFETDDEAFDIWRKVGVAEERILRKGKKDNFWGPPGASGSCGPCSEIHYDLGEQYKCDDPRGCSIDTCECDRWVEIWNLVFTELYQDEEGNQSPLEFKNVDTGMGLERITMVCQGVASTFETDLLMPIMDEVCKMCGVPYKKSEKTDVSLRIITDHARCVTFLISDGVVPGNEGRSYVLRMILRRALRHGKMLGLELPFLYKLVNVIVDNYGKSYPDLIKNKQKIIDIIKCEEEKFAKTLDRGYKLLNEFISSKKNIDGESAFRLYDTFGFPFELTREIAEEQGLKVDEVGFKKAMNEQKARAKAAAQKISVTGDMKYGKIEKEIGATTFVGYEQNECDAKILATVDGDGYTDVMLDETTFYAECGGQVGDSGVIENESLKLEVLTTFKVDDLYVHRCNIVNGEIKIGESVKAKIDVERREEIRIHHTNAHLLQAALVKVLGDEVKQAGSMVCENATRFDFTFSRAMTTEEVQKVEDIMNNWIGQKIEVHTDVMSIEEAKKTGATALFGEKYGDMVRVVSVGNVSKEFCAGTHAHNIGDLRLVKIISESAISSGTRRIEAAVGTTALKHMNQKEHEIDRLSTHFKAPYNEVFGRVEKLQNENKELQKKLEQVQKTQAKQRFSALAEKTVDIEGGKLFAGKVEAFDGNTLKEGVEYLSQRLGGDYVIVVVSPKTQGEGATIISKVSDGFVKKGIMAGKIVSGIAQKCNGKGGGRPQFAQGGLQDLSALDEAIDEFKNSL